MTSVPREDSDRLAAQSDQSSLCVQWVAKDPRLLQVDNKDSDRAAAQADLSLRWTHVILLILSCCGSFIPKLSLSSLVWATSWENLFLPHAKNKGTDQPAHLRSLINTFVVHCLDSIIPLVSISEISSLYLASVDAQAGLSLPWSKTLKTGFLVMRLVSEATITVLLQRWQDFQLCPTLSLMLSLNCCWV